MGVDQCDRRERFLPLVEFHRPHGSRQPRHAARLDLLPVQLFPAVLARVRRNVTGNLFRMVSPGFFTRAQWLAATIREADPCNLPNCRGHLNVTMLAGFLGVSRLDGIIPDSAFGVKEPIPRWPFYLLIALVVFFLFLAFLFWVEENPGTFPRIETWWARTRGRIARTIAPLRPQRRPKA